MSEYTHPYNLLASAVAGRTITVHWHRNERLSSYTDSQSIYLLQPKGNVDQHHEVVAQALLIRTDALSTRVIPKLVGRKSLAERYVYAEICRATNEFRHMLPRKFCSHPGLTEFDHVTSSSQDSLRLAQSRVRFPPIPDFVGSIRTIIVLKTRIPEAAFSGLTKKQQRDKVNSSDTPGGKEPEHERPEESKTKKRFDNPLFSSGKLTDMLNSMIGRERGGKPEELGNSAGGGETKLGKVLQAEKKGVFATIADLALDLVGTSNNNVGSSSYPEWDYAKQIYRPAWTLVDEMDPWREESESDQLLNESLRPPPPALKRELTGIGLSFETHHGQQEGEDYALDKVVDFVIDCRIGTMPDERLFDHRKRTRRDLAVMVLLDISGSTSEKDTFGRSIHQKQMQLAYHITRALHDLGDQVALYAFHSWGRALVRLLRIKSFKEQRLGSSMQKRFSMLDSAGYTRSGAALRHAAKKLKEETRMPYCVLIVITDGFSYDQDYEGKYGEEDTRKALEEIRAQGIGCLCLTIGSSQEEEKLAEVYGPASTLSVRDYDQFIKNLRPAMLKAISQISAG